jgi:hypothetical protein
MIGEDFLNVFFHNIDPAWVGGEFEPEHYLLL